MPKFLAGAVMFPAKLVAYPLLSVVAIMHGILVIVWDILAAIATNSRGLVYGAFAAWTSARIANNKINESCSDRGIPYCWATLYLVCLGGGSIITFLRRYDGFVAANEYPILKMAVLLLVSSNILSILYEIGRVYYRDLTGSASSRQDGTSLPEAKIAAPQSYDTMFSKISDTDKVSEEEGWTLLQEAVEVGKSGKMKLGDMSHLVKMVSDRAPTPAVVR